MDSIQCLCVNIGSVGLFYMFTLGWFFSVFSGCRDINSVLTSDPVVVCLTHADDIAKKNQTAQQDIKGKSDSCRTTHFHHGCSITYMHVT